MFLFVFFFWRSRARCAYMCAAFIWLGRTGGGASGILQQRFAKKSHPDWYRHETIDGHVSQNILPTIMNNWIATLIARKEIFL